MAMLKRRGPRKHRPVLRYHGGKFMIAPWIVSHFPDHDCYTECFGGGASVLLRKERSAGEIYNDLDSKIVNVFRCLQDPEKSKRLVNLLKLTPYSREEFYLAYEETEDDVEAVRRTIVRSFMGFGSDGTSGKYRTGFRGTVTKAQKTPASEWANYPWQLTTIIDRIAGVTLENTDAFELLERLDGPKTLHYVDPPYHPDSRSRGNRRRGKGFHVYEHELEVEDHVRLLDLVDGLKGMVALSGYDTPLYSEKLRNWTRVEREHYADGGKPRLEILWLNERLTAALEAERNKPIDTLI